MNLRQNLNLNIFKFLFKFIYLWMQMKSIVSDLLLKFIDYRITTTILMETEVAEDTVLREVLGIENTFVDICTPIIW